MTLPAEGAACSLLYVLLQLLPSEEASSTELALRHSIYRVLGGHKPKGCFAMFWQEAVSQFAMYAHSIEAGEHLLTTNTKGIQVATDSTGLAEEALIT